MMFDVLKDEICKSGFAATEVYRVAGLDLAFMHRVKRGERRLTDKTVMRIRVAIAELRRASTLTNNQKLTDGRNPNVNRVAACYRLAVSIVAEKRGICAREVLAMDPAKRATADERWAAAAQVRRLALYIANQYLNITQAELARVAGMSKAAVSIALNDVEDLRSDPATDAMFRAIEEAFV